MSTLEETLRGAYGSGHAVEWDQEKEGVISLIERIKEDISAVYTPILDKVYMGSTALVWTVEDKRMKVARALKMARPRPEKVAKIIRVIRDEANKLKSLNHHNVIRIFWENEVPLDGHRYPYYIMEFLPDIKDFRKVLTTTSVTLERLIELISGVVEGIAYLHKNGIIHCDLKPENLLVPADSPPLVADLGYAKYFAPAQPTNGDRLTEVTFTPKYAHPDLRRLIKSASDSGGSVSEIKRQDLGFAFDLYATGRSIFELMRLFMHHQVPDDASAKEASTDDQSFAFLNIPLERSVKVIDSYKWHYLWVIAARMLDGKNDTANCVPGLNPAVMDQIKYTSIQEVQLDFLKLRDRYSVETRIPELNIYEQGVLQIATKSPVVFSERIRTLYNHPHLHRLAKLSQLGLLRYIYPGAAHSRLEHSLGTFANTCRYVRSLYNDSANPLFKSIMSEEDIKAVLLAALLHDVGHYPFAHDLEELDPALFEHESFTFEILNSDRPIEGCDPLPKIIKREWGVEVSRIQAIINPKRASAQFDFRTQILASIIDGPIDADKLDYLYRDSVHLGVPYGQALDSDRLCKCLTVTYSEKDNVASIGISEKGRISAESVAFARYAMFMCAYWHHTSRALKVMLREAVKNVLQEVGRDEIKRADFRRGFKGYVFEGLGPALQMELVPYSPPSASNKMDYFDYHMLAWFHRKAGPKGRWLIEAILGRRLFRRIRVISSQLSSQLYTKIADLYLVQPENVVDKFVARFQSALKDEIIKRWTASGGVPEGSINALKAEDTLILIDAPSYRGSDERALRYLREKSAGTYELESSVVWSNLHDRFNENVSKVRVFAHWSWDATIKNTLPPADIDKLLDAAYEEMCRQGFVKRR